MAHGFTKPNFDYLTLDQVGARLSLTTGVPVTTSDVTGAASIYWVPQYHNRLSLYDGVQWGKYYLPEIGAVPTLTNAKNYDIYAFSFSLVPSSTDTGADTVTFSAAHGLLTGAWTQVNITAGGLTAGTNYFLRATSSTAVSFHTTLAGAIANTGKVNLTASITATLVGVSLAISAAWTNDSTRADALTTQDGVYVKSGAVTRRYLGTIRASGTNTMEDSKAKRFVWNLYNQEHRPFLVTEATNSWSYATATYRQANNSTANQVAAVLGLAGGMVRIKVHEFAAPSVSNNAAVSIGEDSTTTPVSGVLGMSYAGGLTSFGICLAEVNYSPSLGYHFWAWLERSHITSGSVTWVGDNGQEAFDQCGIQGWIKA